MTVRNFLATATASLVFLSGCGGQNSTVVRNYQTPGQNLTVTPESLCIRNSLRGWICSGRGSSTGSGPCDITSTTEATLPTPRTRVTIGVGEKVDLSSSGRGWSVSGSGTLNGTTSPVVLTAGATAGSVTVSVGGYGTVCTANSITFTVIAPSILSYYNADSSVAHTQGMSNIGIKSNLFLAPDSVSFANVWAQEAQAYFSASGSYACWSGKPHESAPNPDPSVGAWTAGKGTALQLPDYDNSGDCSGNQIQPGSEAVTIPTQYALSQSGPWYSIGTVASHVSEDATGKLTISKDQASGQTTVNSISSGF